MGSMNVVGLFFQASFLVQCIMLILLGFSVVSWAVILQKSKALNKTKKEIISFNKKFWSLTELNSFYNELDKKNENIQGIETIFYYGFKEFHRLYQINPNMANAALDGSLRMMKLSMNKELDSLEDNIPLLGTVGSISPYIGLFGTVWGIMHAFISLGEVKQATLQMVAPGIAEALIATAIGLFAAIPAVMAHNRLTLKVSQIEQSYSNFIEEFSTILQRQAIAVRK